MPLYFLSSPQPSCLLLRLLLPICLPSLGDLTSPCASNACVPSLGTSHFLPPPHLFQSCPASTHQLVRNSPPSFLLLVRAKGGLFHLPQGYVLNSEICTCNTRCLRSQGVPLGTRGQPEQRAPLASPTIFNQRGLAPTGFTYSDFV